MRQTNIAINLTRKPYFYYGWVITAITSLSVFFSGPGQTYFISAFIDLYIKEFGWSRATVSSMYSASTLVSGLLLFIIGRFTDRYGQKKMMIIVAALLGASCIWNSFISGLWMLFLGFFTGRIMGQGSMTLIPSTIIPHWFISKRAFAFSLMSVGSVAGSSIIPPLNTVLIDKFGWNNTWRLWAMLLWFFFIPIVYFFLFNKPKDLGLQPDNNAQGTSDDNQTQRDNTSKSSWTLKEAMRTKTFWFMLLCQINLPMIHTGIVFHFMSIMGAKGFSASTSSFILSLLAIVSFPSTFLAGYVLDRLKAKYAAGFICFLLLAGSVVLMNTASIFSAVIFAIIQGIAMGFNSVFSGLVWPTYFGVKHLGSIRGAAMTATVIGSALGPLPFGIAYDILGRYNEAFILIMLFPASGIIAALLSRTPVKDKHYKS